MMTSIYQVFNQFSQYLIYNANLIGQAELVNQFSNQILK